MLNYKYRARDRHGKLVEGVMAADSEKAVARMLKQMEYIPVSIEPASVKDGSAALFPFWRRITFTDLNLFSRQLFTLQRAGVPLLSSLNSLQDQTSVPAFKAVIGQLARDIESGLTLSSAMARHPRVFNPYYVSMVKAGEVSGKIAETFERLAVLGEHEEKIRLRIQQATRYPLIVVAAIVLAFLILIAFVVPRFQNLYHQAGAALPLPTQILLWIHWAVTKFWWLSLAVVAAVIFCWRRILATAVGRWWWDGFKLRIPVFGPLSLKMLMSRFSRATGTLMTSGVPILQILELTAENIGNVVIARTIVRIKDSVNEGRGMSEPMKESGMFPPVVIQMVAVGEETGKIDELLLHVAEYYDSQVDYTLSNLVSLIEPMLIFTLAVMVLFMALGIFLPMWNLMSLFKR